MHFLKFISKKTMVFVSIYNKSKIVCALCTARKTSLVSREETNPQNPERPVTDMLQGASPLTRQHHLSPICLMTWSFRFRSILYSFDIIEMTDFACLCTLQAVKYTFLCSFRLKNVTFSCTFRFFVVPLQRFLNPKTLLYTLFCSFYYGN